MKVFAAWWKRLLRTPVAEPTRIIVIGHDIRDARRACEWLDVSPSCARSATSIGRLRGFSRGITFYVTPYSQMSPYAAELHDLLAHHAAMGGIVIWMEERVDG